MDPVGIASLSIHWLVAGIWAGSVVFVTLAVLPLGRDGSLQPDTLRSLVGTATTLSRISAVLLPLTGAYMAVESYTVDSITGTGRGHLLLTMIVLWVVLMGMVEVGASKIRSGTDQDKLREPARAARPFFIAGSLAAVLLLVIAGLFSAQRFGFLTL